MCSPRGTRRAGAQLQREYLDGAVLDAAYRTLVTWLCGQHPAQAPPWREVLPCRPVAPQGCRGMAAGPAPAAALCRWRATGDVLYVAPAGGG